MAAVTFSKTIKPEHFRLLADPLGYLFNNKSHAGHIRQNFLSGVSLVLVGLLLSGCVPLCRFGRFVKNNAVG
jgi:hypothetical protein